MQVLDSKHATTGASRPAEASRPMNDAWIAHKFGGTSLADANCLRQVASILRARPERHQAIVVSAMRGVTDALLALALSASRGESGWSEALAGLRARHLDAARDLLGDDAPATEHWLDRQFAELGNLLHALSVLGAPGREALERIQGLGELYSAQLLSTYMQSLGEPTACMDAREVLVVRNGELGVTVDWAQSAFLLASWREQHPQPRVVITGFIARDEEGRATILGATAAIFPARYSRPCSTPTNCISGPMSTACCRPIRAWCPEAVPLASLSYHEAFELAYFGAKVIHPQTMTPALSRNLPVIIRNTFNPDIRRNPHHQRKRSVRTGEGPDAMPRACVAQRRRRRA